MHGNTSIQLLEIAMGSSHLQVLSGVYGEGAQIEKYQLGWIWIVGEISIVSRLFDFDNNLYFSVLNFLKNKEPPISDFKKRSKSQNTQF